jgi:hypothetical protein
VEPGRWTARYAQLTQPEPYGDDRTYRLGARLLASCALVEDWGCGSGWLRRHVPPGRYRGVDGSPSRFADVVADLREYTSDVDGVFMRHVLEHNVDWARILANAVASFRKRLVLVLFTPMVETTHVVSFCPEIQVPDIAFSETDLVRAFCGLEWKRRELTTRTHFGVETMYVVTR